MPRTRLQSSVHSKQVARHAAEGGDSGAGGDQNHVFELRVEHEQTVRTVEVRGLSNLEAAQKIGHEAFIHAVEAEIEGIVAARRRSDGVGAGDKLVFGTRLAYGDELSGHEIKRR